jgi:hypothetical protein
MSAGAALAEAPASPDILIYSFPKPPDGFQPLTASDAELSKYGLPPRPTAASKNEISYATWSRAMASAKQAVTPQVMRTGRQHMRALMADTKVTTHRAGTMYSSNWAGQTILSNANSFGGGSYAEVLGEWQVPAVQQAIGTCGGTDVSAMWVGIDGAGSSSDVLQAGTEQDAYCGNGYTQSSYYAWFEWYPNYEYEITNFPVAPGATMLVVVQATSATTATAVFVDVQSNQFTVVGFGAPAGTRLTGNSAEWIVERPNVNNTPGNLADYGQAWMSAEVAFLDNELNTNTYDVAATGGPGRTPYVLEMLDANGNPLSTAHPQGTSAEYWNVTGSAY